MISCDECSDWFHQSCINEDSTRWDSSRDLLWTCKKCGYIYIIGFIITCMLHVYTLYTLHNTLNNDNGAKKWNAIAIERGGPKIMTGSPYSYYYRDPGSPFPRGPENFIRDAKLRGIIEKGPSFREQNYIDWNINKNLYKEAVAKYKRKWTRKES